jgi:hypothetical protein
MANFSSIEENMELSHIHLAVNDVPFRYRPRFFDQVGHQTMSSYVENKHFFTKSCHCQTYQNYEHSSKFAKFVLSKSIFGIKNQPRLSNFFFCKEYLTRRSTLINEIF